MYKKFISALIKGIVWAFSYLFIRRYLNPENKGNVDKFKKDAIYGGIATIISIYLNDFLNETIIKSL
jgi:hypothetical protein